MWLLYYPLFILATFNRETTCFLTIILALTALGRKPLGRIALHVAAQFVIWASIKTFLFSIYRDNPGAGFGISALASNMRVPFTQTRLMPGLLASLGFLWIPVLVFWHKIPDHFVRRSVLAGPLFFLALMVNGNLPEVRIYGEMIPVFLPAFSLILCEFIRTPLSSHAGTPQD
jgi:hypothetical protein